MTQRGNIPQFRFQDPGPQAATGEHVPAQAQPLDFASIMRSVDSWRRRALKREQEQAHETMQEAAIVQQAQRRPGEVAETPDVAREYQQTFEQTARKVHTQKTNLDARRTRGKLAREHEDDPAGFRTQWNKYVDEIYNSLQESGEYAYAEDMKLNLQAEGEGVAKQLEDNKHARDKARLRAESHNSFNESVGEIGNQLLGKPSETFLTESIQALHDEAGELFEAGDITTEQYYQMRDQATNKLTNDYLWGKFEKARANDNWERVDTIIDNLRAGEYFTDNEIGRQMATRLENSMLQHKRSVGKEQDQKFQESMRPLQKKMHMAAQGRPVSMEEVDEQLRVASEYAQTDEQEKAMVQVRNDISILEGFKPLVQQAGPQEIAGLKNQFDRKFQEGKISQGVYDYGIGALRDQYEHMASRSAEGDYIGAAQGKTTPVDPLNTNPEALHLRQEETAKTLGIPKSEVDFYSDDEIEWFEDTVNDLYEQGEEHRATEMMVMFFSPALEDEKIARSLKRQLDDHGDTFNLLMPFIQRGDVEGAQDALIAEVIGGQVSDSQMRSMDQGFDPDRFYGNEVWQKSISIMADHSPKGMASITDQMATVYRGLSVRGYSQGLRGRSLRNYVNNEMEKLLKQFSENAIQVGNNYFDETALPETVNRDFINKVESVLDRPDQEIGRHISGTREFVPEPTADGMIYRDVSTGQYAHDADGNKFVTRWPDEPEPTPEEKGERPAVQRPGFDEEEHARQREEGLDVLRGAWGWVKDRVWEPQVAIKDASKDEGVSESSLTGLWRNTRRTHRNNEDSEVWGDFLRPADGWPVRADAKGDVNFKALGMKRDDFYKADNQPRIMAHLFGKYNKQFDSEKQAKAALLVGPDGVRELTKEYGDRWHYKLPMEFQEMIK